MNHHVPQAQDLEQAQAHRRQVGAPPSATRAARGHPDHAPRRPRHLRTQDEHRWIDGITFLCGRRRGAGWRRAASVGPGPVERLDRIGHVADVDPAAEVVHLLPKAAGSCLVRPARTSSLTASLTPMRRGAFLVVRRVADPQPSSCASVRPLRTDSGRLLVRAAWRRDRATAPSARPRTAISKRDRTTSPELERFLAKRMKAKTIELDSGHLSLITHPRQITELILRAAHHSG
jgi:hypothetical protein